MNLEQKRKYIFISLKNYHIVVREIFVTIFFLGKTIIGKKLHNLKLFFQQS